MQPHDCKCTFFKANNKKDVFVKHFSPGAAQSAFKHGTHHKLRQQTRHSQKNFFVDLHYGKPLSLTL